MLILHNVMLILCNVMMILCQKGIFTALSYEISSSHYKVPAWHYEISSSHYKVPSSHYKVPSSHYKWPSSLTNDHHHIMKYHHDNRVDHIRQLRRSIQLREFFCYIKSCVHHSIALKIYLYVYDIMAFWHEKYDQSWLRNAIYFLARFYIRSIR